ncbi:energy-coupling factor transporter transmembrane protein EcfT [Halobacillus salinarum]|uniref:Energy-coupling factor transporter transmembrane protein EcfT n=1 Tax=Halobacillus salinarum TaxID=2932257 RepID=A0ABY4EJF2_9BACI|nr:energy-coupling factor transporter transmembrane component T [Halobacillus salinarum]UOQ44587.1 energy-coupling factor transporter transmembrane protein EcfT [Halobacillus salinarum]
MSSSMVIGQYIPGNSVVHKLDPRSKIAIIFFYVVIVFFANSVMSYGLLTIFAVGSALITRIPLTYIVKGLKPVWFLILFTFLLHLIVTKQGEVVFTLFGWKVYDEALIQGAAISLRFFLLIMVTSLLTLTTTPIEITDAIEELLGPLKKVRFPVHELALMMSISLRFIPTLMQETEKISKAQASRGVDFRTGSFKDRVKAIIPLLVPLFVSAFKRAEELAMAMEARGYRGGEGRTKLRELQIGKRDIGLYFLFSALILGLFLTRS